MLVNSEIPGLRVEYSVDDGATWIISERGLTLSPLALKLDEREDNRVLFKTR
jgi:Chitobiase/beta-hexosaminidase C-terminal domain